MQSQNMQYLPPHLLRSACMFFSAERLAHEAIKASVATGTLASELLLPPAC